MNRTPGPQMNTEPPFKEHDRVRTRTGTRKDGQVIKCEFRTGRRNPVDGWFVEIVWPNGDVSWYNEHNLRPQEK